MSEKNIQMHKMQEMPQPTPGKGGAWKLGGLVVVFVAILGAAGFWLMQTPETQDNLREQAASAIDGATGDSLLRGLGNAVRKSPPPPPDYVTNPRTQPGTLAGQKLKGTVGVPIGDAETAAGVGGGSAGSANGVSGGNGSNNANMTNRQGATIVSSPAGSGATPYAPGPDGTQPVMPKVKEDNRVRADLVDDLAAFLVSRYKPAGNGQLNVSVKNLNNRYGQKVNKAETGGRAGFLRYAFQPTMLNGLYGLYVNRFLVSLDSEAQGKNLDERQKRQLHTAIAGRALMVATALDTIVASPDLTKLRKNFDDRTQAVVDISGQMTNTTFELNEMRERKAPRDQLAAMQLRVDGLAAKYRRSLDERDTAQRQLVAALRKGPGQSLDDDSLLFLAQWVTRRMNEGGHAKSSVQSASNILRDLARRCAAIGNGAPAQNAGQSAAQNAGQPR